MEYYAFKGPDDETAMCAVEEYDDESESEVEMVKDICYPVLCIAISAILGLIF